MGVIFAHLRLMFAGSAQHILAGPVQHICKLLAVHICGFCAACLGACEIYAQAQCSIFADPVQRKCNIFAGPVQRILCLQTMCSICIGICRLCTQHIFKHGAKHICRPCAEPICNLCASHSCFIWFCHALYFFRKLYHIIQASNQLVNKSTVPKSLLFNTSKL